MVTAFSVWEGVGWCLPVTRWWWRRWAISKEINDQEKGVVHRAELSRLAVRAVLQVLPPSQWWPGVSPCGHRNCAGSLCNSVLGKDYLALASEAPSITQTFLLSRGRRAPGPLSPCEMGCHSSKGSIVIESQKPGDHPEGGEPKVEPGAEAADDRDTSVKEGAAELKS